MTSDLVTALIAQADAAACEAGHAGAAGEAFVTGWLRVELVAALDALAHCKDPSAREHLARLTRRLAPSIPDSES